MSVAEKIAALFNALTREEVDAMPPVERRRFADGCRHCRKSRDSAKRNRSSNQKNSSGARTALNCSS